MAITRPMLPPKAGYVEVEVDGHRTYRNVQTGELIGEEVVGPTTDERLASLEDALAQTDETAIELFEAQEEQKEINAAQDDALIEIYELLEG